MDKCINNIEAEIKESKGMLKKSKGRRKQLESEVDELSEQLGSETLQVQRLIEQVGKQRMKK